MKGPAALFSQWVPVLSPRLFPKTQVYFQIRELFDGFSSKLFPNSSYFSVFVDDESFLIFIP